jgi:hypothetical protein
MYPPFLLSTPRFFTPGFLPLHLVFPSLCNSFFGNSQYAKNLLKLNIIFGYIKNPQKRNFNFNLLGGIKYNQIHHYLIGWF